jgi:hypothetical protein
VVRKQEMLWQTAACAADPARACRYFGAGLQSAAPGRTHFGPPHRTLALGRTHVSRQVFDEYLRGLQPRFTQSTYDLMSHNCNNFSHEVATFLVGSASFPVDILDLPRLVMSSPIGPLLAPMLAPMSAALAVGEAQSEPEPAPSRALPEAAVDAGDEAAFEESVRQEFSALVTSGMCAGEAADLAVSRVLERSGLA